MISTKKTEPLVKRRRTRIERNDSRVIISVHMPGNIARIGNIVNRVIDLSERMAEKLLNTVKTDFYDRHRNLEQQLHYHYEKISEYVPGDILLSDTKKALIGAYFTKEYSVESAALFNPSIVMHPDQEGVKNGELRFIMSLRATGEGHISSVAFRSGIILQDGALLFDATSEFVETPAVLHDPSYDNHLFCLKLKDMKSHDETSRRIFEKLPDIFSYSELLTSIGALGGNEGYDRNEQTIQNINWLANSNYKIQVDKNSKISERVIFPVSENESRGIEDARFVRFYDENDEDCYYATYTAYNGESILPHLLKTCDFLNFDIITLNGK
ncbi:MAG: glycosidase, partial [Bacteroidetes bacterium]|nr:glycosidase [Bacteroidota bacterium]